MKYLVIALLLALCGCGTNFRQPFLAYDGPYSQSVLTDDANPFSTNVYVPNVKLW